ncbi:alginate lyase family protein [Janthinobacterium agaricidamnosum]|uniref:Alginate lyase domain-containing protein n=1 Tax=Janthinobacterium agaricidamnosum NBRC 102515 = DSM 9628 TaxID=1349767 RepID=W0V5I6_9BURK|nr:alginate lyase family protein [Janthinobacterium agaricidamnosum]CDG82613.1 putative uncharacterized protein [Janthinobacterium agaricidamnosum NBRC 102515 = DSM 9628]
MIDQHLQQQSQLSQRQTRLATPPHIHRRRLLGAAAAGMLPLRWALAANPAPPTTFALMPATRAASLAAGATAVLARQLGNSAERALERQPHFMSRVHTEGLLDGEGQRAASLDAQEDWRQARLQALAYRLSGRRACADAALRYLDTWLGKYQPSFNPIDETELPSMLWAADLLAEQMPADLVAAGQRWCVQLARGYLSSDIINGPKSTSVNNWQSHRVKIGTAAAFYSGDAKLIKTARIAFMHQVMRNIDADGKTYDFAERDALHYVTYTLEPLLMTACMAAAHGQDWYGAEEAQGRLAKAVEWMRPYILGQRMHDEFVHSKVPFDARRADAGVKGYSGTWDRNQASSLCWLACKLDKRYEQVGARLAPSPAWLQVMFSQRYYS